MSRKGEAMTPEEYREQATIAWEKLKASKHLKEYNGHLLFHQDCPTCEPVKKLGLMAEETCRLTSRANWINPTVQGCEVCGGEHCTYECCDQCNYEKHLCHFCGDNLGHEGISACYIWTD
jgi:hypothetical protein